MDRLTIIQRIQIIKTYHKTGDSATATYRALKGYFGFHNHSNTQPIGRVVQKFEATGVITNIGRPVHQHFVRSTENMTIVCESVAKDPNVSIPRRS